MTSLAVGQVNRDAKDGDAYEHLHHGELDVKEGIHSIPQHQIRVLVDLSLRFGYFDLKLFHQHSFQRLGEVLLAVLLFETLRENWRYLPNAGRLFHRIRVFDVHQTLVDLLPSKHLFFGFSPGLVYKRVPFSKVAVVILVWQMNVPFIHIKQYLYSIQNSNLKNYKFLLDTPIKNLNY